MIWALSLLFFEPTVAAARQIVSLPAFSLETVTDGAKIDEQNLKGKVLLINFFATWCGPCRQELPSLIKLQQEFGAANFSVIGISSDESSNVVLKFIKKNAINYPVIMSDPDLNQNFGGVSSIPLTFLFNSNGALVKAYRGYTAHEVFKGEIGKLLY